MFSFTKFSVLALAVASSGAHLCFIASQSSIDSRSSFISFCWPHRSPGRDSRSRQLHHRWKHQDVLQRRGRYRFRVPQRLRHCRHDRRFDRMQGERMPALHQPGTHLTPCFHLRFWYNSDDKYYSYPRRAIPRTVSSFPARPRDLRTSRIALTASSTLPPQT